MPVADDFGGGKLPNKSLTVHSGRLQSLMPACNPRQPPWPVWVNRSDCTSFHPLFSEYDTAYQQPMTEILLKKNGYIKLAERYDDLMIVEEAHTSRCDEDKNGNTPSSYMSSLRRLLNEYHRRRDDVSKSSPSKALG
jgi:hypothetical protein